MGFLVAGIILIILGILDLINRKSEPVKIAQKKAGWSKYLMPIEFIVGAVFIMAWILGGIVR